MPNWKGNWIWCSGEPAPHNFYLYTRKVIDLPEKPKEAIANVCGDSRYILFVNGEIIGRGPTRSFPEYQHYDEYDIAKKLKKGKNVITALVHHYGEDTFLYHLGRGAFLFDAQIETKDKTLNVVTDNTWKVLPSEAWYRDIPRMGLQIEFQEIYDMNKAPGGWTGLNFDDSGWEDATVVGPVGTPPWNLIPRAIPFLPEYEIYPTKVMETGAADASKVELPENDKMNISFIQFNEEHDKNAKGLFTNAKSFIRSPQIDDFLESDLIKPDGEPVKLMEERCAEANAELKDIIVKPSADGRASYVALDFGKEVMGYVHIKLKSSSGGVIDMGYSERLENGVVNMHYGNVRFADRIILKPGEQDFTTFEKRAFRYMQIDFRDLNGPVTIESVGLRFSTYPVSWKGSFACSDSKMTDIWKTSVYTVQLNMEDGYTDCPWRERTQWWGDARVESLVNYYAFGDKWLIRQGIQEMARSQHEDGITHPFAPGALGPVPPIPSFTLIWILSIADYYQHTGDKELVAEIYPNVKKALKWFEGHIRDMGLPTHFDYWMFIDWAPIDIRGAVTTLICFFIEALRKSAELAAIASQPNDGEHYLKLADSVTEAVNKHLFNEEKGVYIDCYCDGAPSETVSEQSNSLAVLYNIAPEEKKQYILDYIHNPEADVVRAGSPYFSFYVLQALWHAGQKKRAYDYIRDKWGYMLSQGATTTWESWKDSNSLCHGWSGGPGMDLPAQVNGVRVLEPGWKKFEIAPETFKLKWAEAVVPTPYGDIETHWKRDGGFKLSVTVPKGTTAVVTLPDKIDAGKVKINGQSKLLDGVKALKTVNGKPSYSIKGGNTIEFNY